MIQTQLIVTQRAKPSHSQLNILKIYIRVPHKSSITWLFTEKSSNQIKPTYQWTNLFVQKIFFHICSEHFMSYGYDAV